MDKAERKSFKKRMRPYQKDTVNIVREYGRNKIKYLNYNEYVKYPVKRKNFRLGFKNPAMCC